MEHRNATFLSFADRLSTVSRRSSKLAVMWQDRRRALVGVALVGAACTKSEHAKSAHDEKDEGEEDVSPPEDLMREHGALNRILLVYEECARRVEAAQPAPPQLAEAASIVQRFIEGYHEKLEEDFLFPRFEKAGKLVDLVATLRRQHEAGRKLTADVLRLGGANDKQLVQPIRLFVRMYRPHEAREDTVLFPAIRSVVGKKEFDELGERFEAKEHELFGKEGFEGVVAEIGKIEQGLGLFDLNQYTLA